MQKWQCRISPTLGGGFAGTPNDVWGTRDYENDQDPTVFMGVYGLPDFYALWRHKGIKEVFWCGSDIRHFIKGYWLEDEGRVKLSRTAMFDLAHWMDRNCGHWVENQLEREALKDFGVTARIAPSFLGNVDNFPVQKIKYPNRYYSSVSGNDFEVYGWEKVNLIAEQNPKNKYYLYGNTVPWEAPKNVVVRGRLSQQDMDKEIKEMAGAIRMTKFEGFSEIVAKSVLWGQKPISLIEYPFLKAENPREELLKVLNKYPWVSTTKS